MEYKGLEYLRNKLRQKRTRVLTRYTYYEMKDKSKELSVVIPHELRQKYTSTLGWCAKAVDSLSDRLTFKGFSEDYFDFNGIFSLNNPDILTDSAILSALISSCSFIYIAKENDFPRLQVIDGGNATGIIDEITGMLFEGYAVLERNNSGEAIHEAYFTIGETSYYKKGIGLYRRDKNVAPFALLVPIINRPDAARPFGHSRISRACMYYQEFAKRTMERSDITAEFYSFPQKYVLGTDPEADQLESWRATISSFLQFDKDNEGGHPVIGQFNTPSMSPFTEQIRTAAAGFAGETGLTLDDLGFASQNPSSADAIKASHETLRITARKAQRTFSTGFLNVGFLSACLRDNFTYKRSQIYQTKTRWEPVFTPDASSMGAYGDAILKISQAIPGYFTDERIEDILGL